MILFCWKQISKFELVSDYIPTGDQPQAIDELIKGVNKKTVQTLIGVTGSGKTFSALLMLLLELARTL